MHFSTSDIPVPPSLLESPFPRTCLDFGLTKRPNPFVKTYWGKTSERCSLSPIVQKVVKEDCAIASMLSRSWRTTNLAQWYANADGQAQLFIRGLMDLTCYTFTFLNASRLATIEQFLSWFPTPMLSLGPHLIWNSLSPHTYLHLIFEISSSRNWFLNLIFTACAACKNPVRNRQKSSSKTNYLN